jgi:adenylate cyclase
MAFWNAPLDDPDHAEHAMLAAREMAASMAVLNARWQAEAEAAKRPFRKVAIGIGINSGNCCVGNLGSSRRFDYSAIGDDVNVASRYEGLSKTYGLTVVMGEATVARLPSPRVMELDLIRVKGRAQPTRIFTLAETVGAEAAAEGLLPAHAAMLDAYRGRRWDEAEAAIETCRGFAIPGLDRFYATYCSRIAGWRGSPPPDDWDGAYTATEK